MKNIKRVFALALVLFMALTVTACHKKDEIAVKIGDVEFTSAYYMCALINADSEAKAKVQEELSEDESTGDVDYYLKKIDDKDFVSWVEDTAIDYLKEIAAYKTLCKENDLEISAQALCRIHFVKIRACGIGLICGVSGVYVKHTRRLI